MAHRFEPLEAGPLALPTLVRQLRHGAAHGDAELLSVKLALLVPRHEPLVLKEGADHRPHERAFVCPGADEGWPLGQLQRRAGKNEHTFDLNDACCPTG